MLHAVVNHDFCGVGVCIYVEMIGKSEWIWKLDLKTFNGIWRGKVEEQ